MGSLTGRDEKIHFSFNLIRNPVLSASITAQFVAQELKNGGSLARIHMTLLKKIGR